MNEDDATSLRATFITAAAFISVAALTMSFVFSTMLG